MGLFRSIAGQIRMELTCADQANSLSAIRSLGASLFDVEYVDDLCLRFTIFRKDLARISMLAERKGWFLRPLDRLGVFWTIINLRHRPVLVFGMIILLLLSIYLPGRILFVRVEGNCAVPTNRILEAAAIQGVCIGADARELRSEHIKNALLDEIPQLQWLGVNAEGCVAVISVRERQPEAQQEPSYPASNICAKVDGIIQSVTVTQGTPLCKPGDAVTAGQTLISGYADLGICQLFTQAKGEVFALTRRSIHAVAPQNFVQRDEMLACTEKYALLIGKNRINFYKGSGILDTRCARIYSVCYMTLPGGFVLPIGIVQEMWLAYEPGEPVSPDLDLLDTAQRYLLEQLTDGSILTSQTTIEQTDTTIQLRGNYVCREMVGVTRIEENWNEYGKDPGKDRQR